MKDIIISVIVPVYNVEPYLDRCLESILNQTFKNFELILVNDGSLDKSGKICDSYANKDKRIKVIHKKNGGLSSARNEGIRFASGKFFIFIDSDDYISSEMISCLYDNIVKYDADISECNYITVENDKESVRKYRNQFDYGEGAFLLKKYLEGDLFYGVVTKLFKSELFRINKFPLGRLFEEQSFMLKMCFQDLKFVRTAEAHYYYVKREGSILTSPLTNRKAREYIHRVNDHLTTICQSKVDEKLKREMLDYLKVKSVYWYLDLSLSDIKSNRLIYAPLLKRRIKPNIKEVLLSKGIPFLNKVSYILCYLHLASIVILLKRVRKFL